MPATQTLLFDMNTKQQFLAALKPVKGKTKYKTKAKGYTIDGITSQIINFKTMKQLIQDGIRIAKEKENKTLSDITAERRDDDLSEAFKKANISEKGIELRKHVKIIKNKEISFERNYKKFKLNWRNDKCKIDLASDDLHIKTNPVN